MSMDYAQSGNKYPSTSPVAKIEQSISENLIEQFKRVASMAHNNASHSGNIADRLTGPIPEAAGEANPPSGPSFFDQLRALANEIEHETRRADSNIQRISKCFG